MYVLQYMMVLDLIVLCLIRLGLIVIEMVILYMYVLINRYLLEFSLDFDLLVTILFS